MPATPRHVELELVTDPIGDLHSERVVRSLPGWYRFRGSTVAEGVPRASRSRFRLPTDQLDDGWLDACLDHLARFGIAVHRVHGEHPAVGRANQRLGYL